MNMPNFPNIYHTGKLGGYILSDFGSFFMIYVAAEIMLSDGFSTEKTLEYIYKRGDKEFIGRSGIYVLLGSKETSFLANPKYRQCIRDLATKFPYIEKNIKNNCVFS